MSTNSADNGIREVLVPVSDVNDSWHKCPGCGNTHVMLEGRWQRDFVTEMQDGQIVNEELAEEIVKSVNAINCPECRTRYRIQQDDLLKMKRDLITLRRKVALMEEPPKKDGDKTYLN